MRRRASSPRTTEAVLEHLGDAIRKLETLRHLAERDAARAWKREDDAEGRLHLVHDFYHELLAVEYGIKPAPWAKGQLRDPMPFILAALGDLLGYVGDAKPDRHDVRTWLDDDKPTPVRSPMPYDNGPSPRELRKQLQETRAVEEHAGPDVRGTQVHPEWGTRPMRIGPGNNDRENDGA